MCLHKQESILIKDCLEKLASLMVTFRTYGGRQIDVNRGDFDIDFFRGLNDTCTDIHDKLLSALQGELREQKIKPLMEGEIVAAKVEEVTTLEQ